MQGLKGTIAVGTKLEYVHTSSRNGLKDEVYQVITETGEMAFVDATCFSFQIPKNLYIQNDTTLYKDSTGKKVAKVKKSYGTYYLNQIHYLNSDTYPAGTKIVQVDP